MRNRLMLNGFSNKAEAQRNFFKTLKELRQIEAEYAARPEPEIAPEMGSSREIPEPTPEEPPTPPIDRPETPEPAPCPPKTSSKGTFRDAKGRVVKLGKPPSQRK